MLGLALAAVVLIVAGTLATSDDCGRRTRIAGAAAVWFGAVLAVLFVVEVVGRGVAD